MYNISTSVKNAFKTNARQVVKITFYGTQSSMTITESDITSNGLTVNRYCSSGKSIEIGSAIAAEMNLALDNYDGKFNDTVFEGAELYVQIGVKTDSGTSYVPLGYFTVDESPRKLSTINLVALDRMAQFDKIVNPDDISFPMTVANLASRVCAICNASLGTTMSSLPNSSYSVSQMPEGTDLTYRNFVSWIAEITGTCAFIDWTGKLIFSWYKSTSTTIEASDRFSSDLLENAITITGVQLTSGEDTYLSGSEGYVLNITDNGLVQSDHQTVINNIGAKVNGLSYTPFSATVLPHPHVWPLDIISFKNKYGNSIQTIITDVTFSLNKSTSLQGKGETATNKGYASANPLSKREQAIIDSIVKGKNDELDGYIQSIIDFNNLISNALGLFTTDVLQENGSTIRYLHDAEKLEESTVIFTMTSNGIAWTDQGWNDGEPVWQYGVTSAGEAFFKIVRALRIIGGSIESFDGGETFFADLDNGIIRIKPIQDSLDEQTQNSESRDSELERKIAELNLKADEISTSVSKETERGDELEKQMTEFVQDSSKFEQRISKIETDGVNKVTTENGTTLDDSGFHVWKAGEPTQTDIDHQGVEVTRTSDGEAVLHVKDDGVNALNVTVRKWLIAAGSRLEAYSDSRSAKQTGLFYIGGT